MKRMGRCVGERMAQAHLNRFEKGSPECTARESWQ
jgi:hypothetical protein